MMAMKTTVLHQDYLDRIRPEIVNRRGHKNMLQAPYLEKVVVNSGVGTAKEREALEETVRTVAEITGQHPVITKARKSVSSFKLREGMEVGCRVTLRGELMYNFLYRLMNVALPRVRDFRGISARGFDGAGNFSMGLAEQSMFPEIDLDKSKYTVGMNITVVTTAKTDEEARELLTLLGMPFAK